MSNKCKNVWLYYRLSRDEDKELNSLNNQRQILVDYANHHNYKIIGESSDDNVSGMHFDRKGIEELQEVVDQGLIDTLLVKDLSRLGRHKTQTALFIDYLRHANVNVYSVTENINTLDENDDLIIGFKGLINDSYAKDISKKIRNGYKQKQKEGIVIIPPFGYLKDKLTKEVKIVDECADIVRLIFNLYIDGMGNKKIANYLNEHNIKTPSYYQKQFYNKNNPYNKTKLANKWIWQDRTISEILHNEAYIGTLICGKSYKSTIYHIRKRTSVEDQFRHENYYEPILSKEVWDTAQIILKNRSYNPVRASHNSKIHKYAGLLKCKECNACFVAKIRSGDIEYVCNTYHRRGANYCTSHSIKESDLDKSLLNYIKYVKNIAQNNLEYIDTQIEKLSLNRYNIQRDIIMYQSKISALEEENKNAIKQTLIYPDRVEILNEIITENNNQINNLKTKIMELQSQKINSNEAKNKISSCIQTIDKIIESKQLSGAIIQQLVSKIIISQDIDHTVNIEILLNSPYNYQVDVYTQAKASCADFYSVINKLSAL